VLLSWGVLAELVYHTSTQKLEGFARLKADAPPSERRTS